MKNKQMFLLHFAGGNKYSFEFLRGIYTDFEMIPIELPGRGKRIQEKLITSYHKAVQDIYKQIHQLRNGEEFIIYGHSLGATLALGVASLLEKDSKPPKHLIVSGNPGPGIVKEKKRSQLDKEPFIEMLKELGGLPEEVLESKELLDFVLPILRADFEIVEGEAYIEDTIVDTPITAIMGNLEKYVNHIHNWKKHTRSSFKPYIVSGNHFFIHHHSRKLIGIFKECFSKKYDSLSVL